MTRRPRTCATHLLTCSCPRWPTARWPTSPARERALHTWEPANMGPSGDLEPPGYIRVRSPGFAHERDRARDVWGGRPASLSS